jgi:flagellar biosynthesis/type III secretory pathway chaperone
MDQQLTPLQVVKQLGELTARLDQTVAALKLAEKDAAEKRHTADIIESRAFLNADGAMDIRRHTAKIAADRAEGEALVAEALVRVLRQEIRAIDTRIDVGRTYGVTVRAELKALGYGSDS